MTLSKPLVGLHLCFVAAFFGCAAFGQTDSAVANDKGSPIMHFPPLIYAQVKSSPLLSVEREKFLHDLAIASLKKLKEQICGQNSIASTLQFNPEEFKLTRFDQGDQFEYAYSITRGTNIKTNTNPDSETGAYVTYPTGSFDLMICVARNVLAHNPTRECDLETLMAEHFGIYARFKLGTPNPALERQFNEMFDAVALDYLVQASLSKEDILHYYPQLAYLAGKLPGSGEAAAARNMPAAPAAGI